MTGRRFLDTRGQITVYLALIFLVMTGVAFCIIEGVREYGVGALSQDAVKTAGENVMANYDRTLWKEYHLFFLDPRERGYIEADGRKDINRYFHKSSFYTMKVSSLKVTKEKTAVDEDGLYLKHQIREWMKYQQGTKTESDVLIRKLLQSLRQVGQKTPVCREKILEESQKEDEAAMEKDGDENAQKEDGANRKKDGDGNVQKEAEKEERGLKERLTWKKIQETLQLIMKTGVLYYAVDDPGSLSRNRIQDGHLPSETKGYRCSEAEKGLKISEISFSKLRNFSSLFGLGNGKMNRNFPAKESYLLEYMEQYFQNYCEKTPGKDTVLDYEIEYILGGHPSDLENVKEIAERILWIRFLTNYIFAGSNAELQKQIQVMAAMVAGTMGMPQMIRPVEMLLTGAISYGESLLELHALFSGKRISLIKTSDSWNLTFETAIQKLNSKSNVKKGKWNVCYEDFLKFFLLCQRDSTELCYRMMDLMQENVALKEAGFLMENSLFSFQWSGTVSSAKWYSALPSFGIHSAKNMKISFLRQSSY